MGSHLLTPGQIVELVVVGTEALVVYESAVLDVEGDRVLLRHPELGGEAAPFEEGDAVTVGYWHALREFRTIDAEVAGLGGGQGQRHIVVAAPDVFDIDGRRSLRVPAAFDVQVQPVDGAAEWVEGRAKDVSSRGMGLTCPERFEQGTRLRLRFALPRTDRPIEVNGSLRWTAEVGLSEPVEYALGVDFEGLSEGTAKRLARFVGAEQKRARQAEAKAADSEAADAGPVELPRVTALVVDDSISMRRLLVSALLRAEVAEWVFVEAEDGEDALAKLDPAAFDLVLTDVMMPKLDGIGLVARLREGKRTRDIPIVSITEVRSPELQFRQSGHLPDVIVAKPFTVETFKKVLPPVLERCRARREKLGPVELPVEALDVENLGRVPGKGVTSAAAAALGVAMRERLGERAPIVPTDRALLVTGVVLDMAGQGVARQAALRVPVAGGAGRGALAGIDAWRHVEVESMPHGGPLFLTLSPQTLGAVASAASRGSLDAVFPFDPEGVVVRLQPTGAPSGADLAALAEVRKHGFSTALDAGADTLEWRQAAELFDVVVADLAAHPGPAYRKLLERSFASFGRGRRGPLGSLVSETLPAFVAGGVDSRRLQEIAAAGGYDLVEGNWFTQAPEETAVAPAALPARAVTALALTREVHSGDFDPDRLEVVLRTDPALTAQLLAQLRSAASALGNEVRSIKQAIVMLGEERFRRWASVAAVATVAESNVDALMVLAVVRARTCELLSRSPSSPGGAGSVPGPAYRAEFQANPDEAFMTGLFSLLDVCCDIPMRHLVAHLPIAEYVKEALLGEENTFHWALQATIGIETAELALLTRACGQLGTTWDAVGGMHRHALAWATELATREAPAAVKTVVATNPHPHVPAGVSRP